MGTEKLMTFRQNSYSKQYLQTGCNCNKHMQEKMIILIKKNSQQCKHSQRLQLLRNKYLGMYRISGSGCPDIRPSFAIRFQLRQKYWLAPDSATR